MQTLRSMLETSCTHKLGLNTAATLLYLLYPAESGTKKGRLGDSHGNILQAVRSFTGNTSECCLVLAIRNRPKPYCVQGPLCDRVSALYAISCCQSVLPASAIV